MKTGRPTKFKPELVRRILRSVGRGIPISHAARAAGISHQSLINYRRQNPRFEDAMATAISRGIEDRLRVVERATRSTDEAVRLRAATWWLSHSPHSAPFFSESSRVELSGELDGRVAVLVWPHKARDLNMETQTVINEPNNHHIAGTAQDAD